ncbi:MAG: YraN family protein [Bacteroidia bacterium]
MKPDTIDLNLMQKLTEKRKTGNLGEEIACRYIGSKGYEIIEQNYLKKFGEIDIIARKEGIIHFIEVKSVSRENIIKVSDETNDYKPEDNVHPWKLQRLARTMQVYLSERGVSPETNWQFDVITVQIDKKALKTMVFMLENVIL